MMPIWGGGVSFKFVHNYMYMYMYLYMYKTQHHLYSGHLLKQGLWYMLTLVVEDE